MYRVTKRDGTIAEFDIAKISSAITKAFDAMGKQYHPSVMDMLALRVTAEFEPKIKDELVAVEDIQDSVEERAERGGLRRRGQGLHPLPQAAGEGPQRGQHSC